MRKNRRHDWRNLPPKKMIRSMSPVRLAMKQWGMDPVKMEEIAKEMYKSIMDGFWDALLGHSVAKHGDRYEHTYTIGQENEPHWGTVTVLNEAAKDERHYDAFFPPSPTLKLEMTGLPVSYALYNQLIVREPENSYMSVNATV